MATNIVNSIQIDPVCGMEVAPANAAAKTCYEGEMVFFCTEGCKNAFETNPKTYKAAQRKGFWSHDPDCLGKTTDGKPIYCD